MLSGTSGVPPVVADSLQSLFAGVIDSLQLGKMNRRCLLPQITRPLK
jgi:hypothetical protein